MAMEKCSFPRPWNIVCALAMEQIVFPKFIFPWSWNNTCHMVVKHAPFHDHANMRSHNHGTSVFPWSRKHLVPHGQLHMFDGHGKGHVSMTMEKQIVPW